MHTPLSPTAQAFAKLLREPAAVTANQDVARILPQLGAWSQHLTVDDAITLGFWKSPADRAGALEMASGDTGQPFGLLVLGFTPRTGHVALGWMHGPGLPRLWIDGQELPLPLAADGLPRCIGPGGWCGDRFYGLQVAAQEPAVQDWRALPGTGSRLALWLWDTAQSRALVVEPLPSEVWPSPWVLGVDQNGQRLHVVADRSQPGAKPVRTLTV